VVWNVGFQTFEPAARFGKLFPITTCLPILAPAPTTRNPRRLPPDTFDRIEQSWYSEILAVHPSRQQLPPPRTAEVARHGVSLGCRIDALDDVVWADTIPARAAAKQRRLGPAGGRQAEVRRCLDADQPVVARPPLTLRFCPTTNNLLAVFHCRAAPAR